MTLRLAFDSRWLLQPENHPHAALFKVLLRANERTPFDATFLLYTDTPTAERSWTTPPNVHVEVVPATAPRARAVADFWWQSLDALRAARRDGADLFVSPFYKVPLVPLVRCVNMVHDTSIFRVPEEMIGEKYESPVRRGALKLMLKSSCALAARTLTVSNYSKRCLVEDLQLAPGRVTVCYHGVDALPRDEATAAVGRLRERRGLPRAYTLFVGANIVKKNVSGLLRAWARVPEALRTAHPLLLKTYGEEQIQKTARELGVADTVQVLHAHLADEEMKALFAGAHLLVLPSYDEGFGLPVAEALAAGVPVVVSRGSALEEVGGPSAVLVDPASDEDIARGLAHALGWSSAERERSSAQARKQASLFSIDAAARAFFEALSGAALGSGRPARG